jgi:VWFA-related protein
LALIGARSRFSLCAFLACLCVTGLPHRSGLAAEAGWRALADQRPEQRFRSGIDLVTVDVVVLDSKGEPLQGLTRADFTVREDGKPQEIREFQSVELPAFAPVPAAARPEPPLRRASPVSMNSVTAGRFAGRAFVLVYDDVNLTRNQSAEARRAIRTFLDTAVTNEDAVSLVTTSGGGLFHARTAADRRHLVALLDGVEGKFIEDTSAERMTDYEALRIHINQDTLVAARVRRRYEYYRVGGLEPITAPNGRDDMPRIRETPGNVGVIEPYIESRAAAVYSDAVGRNRITMGVLERALEALGTTRGRKSVILVSKGFIHDQETRGFKDVTDAARRSNVAIYFVDARGLVATTGNFTASEGSPTDARDIGATFADIALDAEGAVSMAETSGGFAIRNTNDLGTGLQRISRESRSYYLVGYVPQNDRADGRFRQIEVSVKRPDVRVRARKGYYAVDAKAVTAANPGDLDPDVRRALDAPRDLADLPVRATALVFDQIGAGARVVVAADVDPKYFQLEPDDKQRLHGIVELAVAATHLGTGQVFHFEQTTELNLRPETKRQIDVWWYPVSHDFTLPPGPYQARVVVRDRNSGRMGSVTHEFEVPPLGGFRVSSPILTDQIQADAAGQTVPRPVLVARRRFASGTTLFCQFTVYNAALLAATRQPQVTGTWVLRRAGGGVVRRSEPRTLTPATDGALTRLYGITLAGLTAGDYELVVLVRDELQVKTAELREPFAVETGVGVSAAPTAAPGTSRP